MSSAAVRHSARVPCQVCTHAYTPVQLIRPRGGRVLGVVLQQHARPGIMLEAHARHQQHATAPLLHIGAITHATSAPLHMQTSALLLLLVEGRVDFDAGRRDARQVRRPFRLRAPFVRHSPTPRISRAPSPTLSPTDPVPRGQLWPRGKGAKSVCYAERVELRRAGLAKSAS
jgi:hypothetical protein